MTCGRFGVLATTTASTRRARPRRASPRPRTTYHHGDLRRELVRVALTLIGEGQGDFTLREAARRIGVNHRAVYNHFSDKRELFVAIALEGLEQLVSELRAALLDLPPSPVTHRLSVLAGTYARFAVINPTQYRVMFGPRLNRDGRFPSIEVALREAMDLVGHELTYGMKRGELRERDVLQSTLSLWSAMHGVAQLIIDRRIAVKMHLLPRYAAELVQPLIDGLARV